MSNLTSNGKRIRTCCAWCKQATDGGPNELAAGEIWSHGICPPCKAKQLTDVLERKLRSDAASFKARVPMPEPVMPTVYWPLLPLPKGI